eukprot:gene14429-14845_t
MSDVQLLRFRFMLDTLHEVQTRFACRRRSCLFGQCQLALRHKVGDVLEDMLCDTNNYTCASGGCTKCGWDHFAVTNICPRLYKLGDETCCVWKVRSGVRNGFTVQETYVDTVTIPEFLEELEREAVSYAAHNQATEHAWNQFKALQESLPVGSAILVLDFYPKFHHEPKRAFQGSIYKQAETSGLGCWLLKRMKKGQ